MAEENVVFTEADHAYVEASYKDGIVPSLRMPTRHTQFFALKQSILVRQLSPHPPYKTTKTTQVPLTTPIAKDNAALIRAHKDLRYLRRVSAAKPNE